MSTPAASADFRPRAVLFDAYGTLFDVYSVAALAEQLFPGRGEALSILWRDKQIEYTRLRTLSGQYKDFHAVTQDGLIYACARLGLKLDPDAHTRLMNQYARLSAFPENLQALRDLKALGIPLAILSNGTPDMLAVAVNSAGMDGLFDHLLSVDAVRQYKTAPAAYQLGPNAFGHAPGQMLFVSSNGWDVCCATWFGYRTFWINRAGLPPEQLDVQPTYQGAKLSEVADLLRQFPPAPA
ncbi:MAG: haloacid dehalogenase type II [Rhodocyclaceae bacterium]|nr:haloacid dehalogenase type II [Rhodocyclaceae bacterium]MBX3666966.1 haloacid dehalogenase type II [Rhodocyclaceae bacterium]